jgi:hypothetical protein
MVDCQTSVRYPYHTLPPILSFFAITTSFFTNHLSLTSTCRSSSLPRRRNTDSAVARPLQSTPFPHGGTLLNGLLEYSSTMPTSLMLSSFSSPSAIAAIGVCWRSILRIRQLGTYSQRHSYDIPPPILSFFGIPPSSPGQRTDSRHSHGPHRLHRRAHNAMCNVPQRSRALSDADGSTDCESRSGAGISWISSAGAIWKVQEGRLQVFNDGMVASLIMGLAPRVDHVLYYRGRRNKHFNFSFIEFL